MLEYAGTDNAAQFHAETEKRIVALDMRHLDLFAIAVQHHQAGHLTKAEALYRQILANEPNHADSLHYSGLVALQMGRFQAAADLISRAVCLKRNDASAYSNLAIALANLNRFEEAVAACQSAISLQPNFAAAHNNLGTALLNLNRLDEAILSCQRAVELQDDYPEALTTLANAFIRKAQPEKAVSIMRRILEKHPTFAPAHNELGQLLLKLGEVEEAIAACRLATKYQPDFAEAYNNLGNALSAAKRFSDAIGAFRSAIEKSPDFAEAHLNLGATLAINREFEAAIKSYRRAIELLPGYSDAYYNLANTLCRLGRYSEATDAYRSAIESRPDFAPAYHNLGSTLIDIGRMDEAILALNQAIKLRPDFAPSVNNLAIALKWQGRLDEALTNYRRTLELDPQADYSLSNIIMTMLSHPGYGRDSILAELQSWNSRFSAPLASQRRMHANNRQPDRKLRIGYISADFRNHPVGRFVKPLLTNHNKSSVSIVCYSQTTSPDSLTSAIKTYSDGWHEISEIADPELADQIRHDEIDILVDLAGHTDGNRLRMFAMKPAPIQVTYLGSPASTGIDTMDYRLTDEESDPTGIADDLYSEELVRLPHGMWCFEPDDQAPAVSEAPLIAKGHVTFGSFNQWSKINDIHLRRWSQLLRAVPLSRLLIKATPFESRTICSKVIELFASEGIGSDRLILLPHVNSHREHMRAHNQIDIALDSFPYHGTTITCEALWMGVPVITLAGNMHVSRVGVSILNRVGLSEFVANDPDQYIGIATELASNPQRILSLRTTMRQRMLASPLMDAPGLARDVEAAYRTMWRTWCSGRISL